MTFDDDMFDAEIILQRAGIGAYCTAMELGRLFGSSNDRSGRSRVVRMVRSGRVPPAAHKPSNGHDPNLWTHAQVLQIVAEHLVGQKVGA